MKLLQLLSEGLPRIWMVMRPRPQQQWKRRTAVRPRLERFLGLQQLEPRIVLYGYITVQNQPSSGAYAALNTTTYSVSAPGVLSGATGNDPPFTAHLVTQASHGTATVNGNGSFSYTPNAGYTGPFAVGWEMRGLYHIYQNTASGVPAGVLLTLGDGTGWYFTQGSGNSYASPNGPEAFSTLISLTGGGWQLTNQYGTVDTFNSSGYLTSAALRTTQATTYTWTGSDLTSITDAFGRSVTLAYSHGLLSSITNFAGSVWAFADTGSLLTSITDPNPGNGSPVSSFGYTGNLMTSSTDGNSNTTGYTFNSYYNLSGETLPGSASESFVSEQNFGYGNASQNQPTSAVLSSTVENSTTDPNNNTSYFSTDPFGDTTAYVDAYGNQTTIARDANGLATQITLPPPVSGGTAPVTNIYHDSLGNETYATGAQPTYGTYVFNSFSEPTSFTDSLNNKWVWLYDTHGNLTSESDPLNNTVSFTVDSLGYETSMTQPAPNNGSGTVTANYTRDSDERLTKVTWPDSTFRTFSYNTIDLPTSVTDDDNHTTTKNYDVLSRVTSVVNALNGTVSTTYDKDNNILTTQDELGNTTSFVWSPRNLLTQETLPAPAQGQQAPVLAFTYDANANELTYTNALNEVTSYSWDKLDRLTQETLPKQTTGGMNPTIAFGYDNDSRKISETNPLNATTTWAYANTDVSQLTSITLPPPSGSGPGLTTSYGFDSDGRKNAVTDAMNHTVTTSFTADGQVASVKDNLNNTTAYAYGHGGELLSTTDPLNHTSSRQYDSRYRLVETIDANNGVTSLTLDGVGNVTKLVDSDNNATTWVLDALNRPTSETNTLGTSYTTYNADSQVTSLQDADGRVRDFTLDNLGRVTAENWMNGNTVVAAMNYGYDVGNELTSASDPNLAYAFAYNGDGQVTSTDNNGTPNVPHVVLTAGYDLAGDMTSQSATISGTKDFVNNYFYDADQRLTIVQQEQQSGGNTVANKEIDYAYNAIGQFTAIGYYNQFNGPRTDIATGAFTYDTDNRLTGLAYTANAGQTSIDSFGWAYNAGSLVTSFTSNDGTASYAYDLTNQVTSATYTTNSGGHQPANESYSFTNNGNRNMSGWTTGSDNTITSDGTFDYSHDADGNQTVRTRISNNYASDYRTTYSWDYRNRLTDVEYFDNNSVLTKHVHYVYDVFNDLIATQVDTTGSGSYNITQRYIVTGGQPVLEFDNNGNLIQRNLVAPDPAGVDAIMAQEATSTGAVTWMLDDNLGTPRDIVNNNSQVVNHIVYASFGQDIYESNSAYVHWNGFGGGHDDTYTGLTQDGLRWYDPSTGKWLSQDPIGFAGGDGDLSRYVGNDPVKEIDPSGLLNPDWIKMAPDTTPPGPNAQYAQQQAKKAAAIQAMGGPMAAAEALAAMPGPAEQPGQPQGFIFPPQGPGQGPLFVIVNPMVNGQLVWPANLPMPNPFNPAGPPLGPQNWTDKAAQWMDQHWPEIAMFAAFAMAVHQHHIFSQEAALKEQFEDVGINIHDWVVDVEEKVHLSEIHPEWNEIWHGYFDNLNADPSSDGVIEQAIEMMEEFGLDPGGLHPFNQE